MTKIYIGEEEIKEIYITWMKKHQRIDKYQRINPFPKHYANLIKLKGSLFSKEFLESYASEWKIKHG